MVEQSEIQEKIRGVVERVTYHNDASGWSVLKVAPFRGYGELATVTVHQTRVFAGSTMEFAGSWLHHPRFGRQFKAGSPPNSNRRRPGPWKSIWVPV